MAKKEVKTDLWVYELLQEANIHLTPQGCDIKEIDEALKTASKSNTGNAGYPEYCGVVKDFILVIEDKASLDKHLYKDEKGLIAQDVKSVRNYAVNGALFYARHLAAKTSYNKVLAIGVSGNEKRHRITPIFVNERDDYQELSDMETFISFNENNIDEFYLKEILHEETDKPGHFWFIEVWASLDKLNAHLETPKLKDLFAKQEQYLSSCTVQTCTNVEEK